MTQSIILRLITRQAGGGEIVRTRQLGSQALIGRGPGCDIHLPDLGVDTEHAMLRVTGQSRVIVESLTGEPFQINGKALLRVELEVARAPVVTFGTYDLLLGQGGEGEVSVTVLRRKQPHPPEPSLFSLQTNMFSRRRAAWVTGLAILLLCLVLPLAGTAMLSHRQIHPDRQWSSGPLSKAHAFLEKDCQACHQKAFVSVRDDACLSCHQAGDTAATARIDARVTRAGSPFLPLLISDHAQHSRLAAASPPPPTLKGKVVSIFQGAMNHPSDRCASCHLEHTTPRPDANVAATADIVRPGKPALVVVNDCAGCHSRLKMRLPSTALVDTPDWNRHPEFRPQLNLGFDGPRPRIERVSLARPQFENNGLTFSHRVHMSATGGVARQGQVLGVGRGYGAALTCQSCHRPDGGGFKPTEMERDCGACHSLAFAQVGGTLQVLRHHDMRNVAGLLRGAVTPASVPKIDPAVLRRALSAGGLCVDCHTVRPAAGPVGAEVAPVRIADRVLPWGDFNHGISAHNGIGKGAAVCADCHRAQTSDRAQDQLIQGVGTCKACHGKTGHETTAAASGECRECHSYHAPGQAPRTGQDRLFGTLSLPAGAKPRGLPTF